MSRITRILLLLAFSLAALGARSAMHPAGAAASTNQQAILEDDNLVLHDPAGALATLRLLGVDIVRVNLKWHDIAPAADSRRRPARFLATDPGQYPASGWRPYDRLIEAAAANHIAVLLTVGGPAPLWAVGPGNPGGQWQEVWKPSVPGFGAFVRATGTRYSGRYRPRGAARALPRVSYWSIWNESNYGVDLAPQAINNDTVEVGAAQYRRLLDAAWSALRADGHGHDTILIGETAPRGKDHPIGNFSGVKPLRFLRALYCVDAGYRPLRGSAASSRGCPVDARGSAGFRTAHPALFMASGFADHPYAQGVPPDTPTYQCGSTTCFNTRTKRSDPDYADLPEVPRLAATLDRLIRVYGSSARLPVYSTEYGYWTKPPDKDARVSPQTAAYYLNWAEYLSWRQPRIASYDQYLLVDPRRGNFASGLELPDRTRKPGFYAFRLPLFIPSPNGRRGHALEVWGCVRPAHFALLDGAGPQQAQIQFEAGGRGGWRTVQSVAVTNPQGYFDVRVGFPSTGVVRIAWTYPRRGTIYSRTVAITIR